MSEPVKAQPQPQYNYGQPQQPGYGPPPGQYGVPPAQYGGPPPGMYGQPGQQYPNPQYTGQPGQYGAPPIPPGHQPPPAAQWMARPEVSGCPPGLEYLTQVDQVLVQQQVELLEAFTGWETANKYKIVNSMGQQVYFAAEESDMCTRQCCGPQRGFDMHITDNMGQEVIRVHREFKCCATCPCFACTDCLQNVVVVESPPGQVVGYVRQQCSCPEPRYQIMDANEDTKLLIKGPCCIIQGPCCTWDQEFNVLALDESTEVGKISKQWSGFVREYFTDADNFGVSFPMDLDVKMKAVMLGAVFLIDFMFFESQQNNNHHH